MADTMIDKVKIGDSVYNLPSGSSAIVNGDNLIIQNRAGGRDMKHKSGTFITSPDENGRVTVEVGFKPEFLKVTLPFDSGDTYAVYDSLTFKDKTYWWIPMESSTRFYTIPDTGDGETGIVEITDTGFVFRSHAENTCNVTCTYEAVMYIPVEGGNKHSYSTEEQVVGTWIDGKPVYESVIDLGYDVRISENADSIFPNQDILNELECETFLDAFAIFNDDKYVGYRNPIEIGKADDTYTYKAMEDWPAKSDRHVLCYLKYTKTTD